MGRFNDIQTVQIPSLGLLPLSDDPGSFTPSGKKRDHVPGTLPEHGGFVEKQMGAKLSLNLNPLQYVDIDALNAVAGEDITIRLKSGAVYMMGQAFCESPVEQTQGKMTVVFMANTSERIS